MITLNASNQDPHAPFITLCLFGDVMTGRGIDQILPHPNDPTLHESYMRSALGYVALAEQAHGPIAKPVDFAYIWGDMLDALAGVKPAVRIANLETAITTSEDAWPGKAVHYRMHPANLPCLTSAAFDCLTLANNHVLDWGYAGLQETLTALERVHIQGVGAGRDATQAVAPAVIAVPGIGRVIVWALGLPSSGIPLEWAASADRPGLNLVRSASDEAVRSLRRQVQSIKQPGDVAVVSIHWDSNWGFGVPRSHRAFAHRLIDEAGVDLVHGHSSHHVRGMEVYRDKLILYGCGDFLDDYEGIAGHEAYRPDLGLMYIARLDPTSGRLLHLHMLPTQVYRMRVRRATPGDARWLHDLLNREGKRFGTQVRLAEEDTLRLQWTS